MKAQRSPIAIDPSPCKGDFYLFITSLCAADTAAQEQWLKEELAKHVPPAIMRAAYREPSKPFVARWLERNEFRIKVWPSKTELTQNDKVLAARDGGWSKKMEQWRSEPRYIGDPISPKGQFNIYE